MVPGRVFRLVAALLLLVQDNEAQVPQRRENGRAGTQHHPDLSPADPLPLVISLRHPQRAVEHRHLVPEIPGEPAHHLGCQHDFRHQHDGGFALFQYFLDQAKIDLGFPAAGNALEQHSLGSRIVGQVQDLAEGFLLLLGQHDGRRGRPAGGDHRDPQFLLFREGHQPRLFHTA